ncbi:MAG: Crp/Fnr family transcriptional regulator [Cyclobacteriaceae bacterium]
MTEYSTHYDSLKDYISQFTTVDEELSEQLMSVFSPVKKYRNTYLLRKGDIANLLYYIAKGSCRFYEKQEGKEITYWLAMDGELVTSCTSFSMQTPANESIQLLEDSTLLVAEREELLKLQADNPRWEHLTRLVVEEYSRRQRVRIACLQIPSAKDRYSYIQNNHPELVQRFSQRHIASFIGVSQETLSRVRATFA